MKKTILLTVFTILLVIAGHTQNAGTWNFQSYSSAVRSTPATGGVSAASWAEATSGLTFSVTGTASVSPAGYVRIATITVVSPNIGVSMDRNNANASATEARIKSTSGNEFQLNSFDIRTLSGSATVTFTAYRDGLQLATHTATTNTNPLVLTAVTFPSTFSNIDEIKLTGNVNGAGWTVDNVSLSAYAETNKPVLASFSASPSSSVATLNVNVNPQALNTTVLINYSTNSNMSGAVAATPTPSTISGGAGVTAVSANLTGLTGNTTYYYTVTAYNAGATTVSAVQSFSTGTLPVKLISFDAKKDRDNVLLKWKTANELDFSHFELERSSNASDFTKIGSVQATGNESYQFIDSSPLSSVAFYRLKMVDIDGAFTYSSVISFHNNNSLKTGAYPNPAGSVINVSVPSFTTGSFRLLLLDSQGKILSSKTYQKSDVAATVSIPVSHLNPGIYHIQLIQDNKKENTSFVKQ